MDVNLLVDGDIILHIYNTTPDEADGISRLIKGHGYEHIIYENDVEIHTDYEYAKSRFTYGGTLNIYLRKVEI